MKRDILGLVLSGGHSRRMGEDKARMHFHGELDQLEFCLQLLGKYCSRLAVSVREDQLMERSQATNVECLVDDPFAFGPMAGVLAGLRVSEGLPVLAIACDMPHLDASLLLSLVCRRNSEMHATCFSASDGAPEPMCTIYEPSCRPLLEALAKEQSYSLRRFLKEGIVERLAYEESASLANVNTPEEAEIARKQIDL
ncbi:molybdenum cofactor guanylyltransferase [Puniceicoccaceae bacterium K14]|nr:molybdenum cofactor guanylyltransferase [Puniceicoccaceae bacterium K14]